MRQERKCRRNRSPRGKKRERRRTEIPQGGPQSRSNAGGGAIPPEENADLLGFTPERVHMLLQGFYGDFPHHNDGSHLDGVIADDAAWQCCWRRLAAISELVCHTFWSGGAPLHGDIGGGMAGGSQQELEL